MIVVCGRQTEGGMAMMRFAIVVSVIISTSLDPTGEDDD